EGIMAGLKIFGAGCWSRPFSFYPKKLTRIQSLTGPSQDRPKTVASDGEQAHTRMVIRANPTRAMIRAVALWEIRLCINSHPSITRKPSRYGLEFQAILSKGFILSMNRLATSWTATWYSAFEIDTLF
ncbi:MAG: hypothetical protein ACNA8W_21925, partial [Bradymonadaceae bacterium]